jgi:hypothetical protein
MPDVISDNSDSDPIASTSLADREEAHDLVNPMAESLSRIADRSERQREKNAPIIIDFTNSKTAQVFHVRLRMIGFVFCATTAADHVSFSFGGRVFDFLLAVGTTQVVFPYEVDRGVDIVFANVTSPDHVTYAYIIAYTE